MMYKEKHYDKLTKELINTNNTLLFLVNKFVILNNKESILKLLKSLRNKGEIIPRNATNADIIEFHSQVIKHLPALMEHLRKHNLINKETLIIYDNQQKGGEIKYNKRTKYNSSIIKIKSKSKSRINNKIKRTRLTKKTKKVKDIKHIKRGGAFLRRLEEKGNNPITGNDIAETLEEISDILERVIYTSRGNKLRGFNTLLNIFRGDKEALDSYLRYFVLPEFASIIPFKLDITKAINESGDLPYYLDAYYAYNNYLNQYRVDIGELKPSDIKPNKFEEMIGNLADMKNKYYQYKMKVNPRMYIQ